MNEIGDTLYLADWVYGKSGHDGFLQYAPAMWRRTERAHHVKLGPPRLYKTPPEEKGKSPPSRRGQKPKHVCYVADVIEIVDTTVYIEPNANLIVDNEILAKVEEILNKEFEDEVVLSGRDIVRPEYTPVEKRARALYREMRRG